MIENLKADKKALKAEISDKKDANAQLEKDK